MRKSHYALGDCLPVQFVIEFEVVITTEFSIQLSGWNKFRKFGVEADLSDHQDAVSQDHHALNHD